MSAIFVGDNWLFFRPKNLNLVWHLPYNLFLKFTFFWIIYAILKLEAIEFDLMEATFLVPVELKIFETCSVFD